MQQRSIDWYFDFISPFAYMQHLALVRDYPEVNINYYPILFGVMLRQHGHKGPAEIPTKRLMTYRYCTWYAANQGIPLRFPDIHPYRPVSVLRLSLAAGISTQTVTSIFEYIWVEGKSPCGNSRLAELSERLGISDYATAISSQRVKNQLRMNTECASKLNIFGVPTIVIDDKLFWGNDMTGMAMAYLANRKMFENEEFCRLTDLPNGLES